MPTARSWIALAVAGAAAFALGASSAWLITGGALVVKGRGPRSWSTSAAIGDSTAALLTRAVVARTGLWALPKSEVSYFLTERDDGGRPLDATCTYELKGRDLPARWWSVAIYVDYHFVKSPSGRLSYTRTNIARDADGGYTLRVSSAPQSGNWLPMGDAPGKFQLLTRLYQPHPSVTSDPDHVPLATIRRVSCA